MDIKDLMGTLLSSDSLKGLSGITGTSQKDVKNVLSSALPSIPDGVMGQANDTQTAEGFVGALSDHAKDDTSDLSSFLSGIDLEDGGKIIAHLLGGHAEKTTEAAAEKAGVEKGKAGSILSAAPAPPEQGRAACLGTEPTRVPAGYYFLLGDNLEESVDSRDARVGLVPEAALLGRVMG